MKNIFSIVFLTLFTTSLFGQRIVFPNQNIINPYLDDPSFLASNGRYNMTGLYQFSGGETSNNSQYITAQLSPFDNFAFGLDYSRQVYDVYRYSQLFLNTRFKLNLGSEFHYINIGGSIGTDRLNEDNSSRDNEISTIFKAGLHYTNFNLTIGGYVNTYPIQNDLLLTTLDPLSTLEGYTGYLSYRIRVSDNLRITPTAKYNAYDDLKFFEGVTNFNYKGNYELALSYKNDYAFSAALSGRFLKYFRVSYAFEKAIGAQNFTNVHSVGISVDLTPKEQEIPEWLANVKRNREKLHSIKKRKDPEPAIAVEETTEKEPEPETEVVAIPEEVPVMSEDSPSDIVDGYLKSGYYIILGSFIKESNANREVERLKSEGYYARIGRKKGDDKFHYIYVDRYDDRDLASKRTVSKQKETGFEKVWLLKIQ